MNKSEELISRVSNLNEGNADIILQQLGGNKFKEMTGAKNFIFDPKIKTLSFKIGKNPKGITHVKIKLISDLYNMVFLKIRGVNVTTVKTEEGIHGVNLQRVFTDNTGLDISL